MRRLYRLGETKTLCSCARQLRHVAAAYVLVGAGATSVYASAIDEALKNFGNELERLNNKEAQLQRPATKSKPVFDPAAARAKPAPGSPQDYVTNRVPIGTEISMERGGLERVLAAPDLNADPVVSCVGLVRGSSVGKELGRFVVDGYSSSNEDTARMKRISDERFKGQFTAMWARVHHVVIESKDYLGRDNGTSSCRGWVRIDRMDLYQPGTGPYPSSRLRGWAAIGLTPAAKTSPMSSTVIVPLVLHQDSYERRPICTLSKNDTVTILDQYPERRQVKVRIIGSRSCATNSVGYVGQRAIR